MKPLEKIPNISDIRAYSAFLLALTLPLPIEISRIFTVGFILVGCICNISSRYYDANNLRQFWPILLFPTIFLIQGLSFLLFTDNQEEGLSHLEKYIVLLLIPLAAMGLNLKEQNIQEILKFFILGCILTIALCFLLAFYKSISWTDGDFIFDSRMEKDPRIGFWRSINWGGNYFFSNGLSTFHHATYLSMYLLLGLGILIKFEPRLARSMTKVLICLLFTATMILLSSRASQLFLIFFLLVLLLSSNYSKRKLIFFVLIFIALLALISFNPRTQELIQKIAEGPSGIDPLDRSSLGARTMVWSTARELIKEHPLTGVGLGDLRDQLAVRYEEEGFQYPLEHRFNAHNDYLEIWATLGLVGLITLIILYVIGFYYAFSTKHWLFVYFLTLISFHGMFESTLQRHSGIVFISFFYSILMIKSIQNHDCNH